MKPSLRARAVVTLVGLTMVAAACGSSDGATAGELRPFSEVQGTDFVFEADPLDPGRGIFRVMTTEPMICTIVWGETEAFGNFNNSLAMNGTGIIDHDVFLPGARPGQTYFFRVQGSTADGRQFRSETGTFTIPEIETTPGDDTEDAASPRGDNLALLATVSDASSSFGPGWEPENAIDGDLGTEWATSGDGDDAHLTLDLGTTAEVVGVEFITRSMADGTAIAETFTVTVDGGQQFGPFPAGNPAEPRFAEAAFTGRELHFEIDSSTGGNVGAVEVRVFGPPS